LSSPETGTGTLAAADEAAEETPRDERRESILGRLRAELGDALVGDHIRVDGDLWIRVTREAWPAAAEVAQRRLGCQFFDFLSGIDWLPSPYGRELDAEVDNPATREAPAMVSGYAGGDTRFQVLARVINVREHWGVNLKADLPDGDLSVGTWTRTYLGANWHERETHEMFGFRFEGHPWLANLYLPGEFEGFPLRKDFPLLSRRVKPWPGIVDVEPMPGEEPSDEGGEGA
jgi:NADH-quinone oxidoreductase subunit C